jgi:hypothetical protein
MRRTALVKLGLAAGVTAAAAVLSLSAASSASAQSLQTAAPTSQADCRYDPYTFIWYC